MKKSIKIFSFLLCSLFLSKDKTANAQVITNFSYTGAVQSFTVPCAVTTITVDVRGAQGGTSNGTLGGLGARMQGTITVTPGQVLSIYVGGQGTPSENAGGGGGGSGIVIAGTPQVIAGGGGGASGQDNVAGMPGLTGTSGGSSSGAGGSAGNGGEKGYQSGDCGWASGGGGYSGDGYGGDGSWDGGALPGTLSGPGSGQAAVNGGAGGVGGGCGFSNLGAGGWGCGGGGRGEYGGGGGGGYSGGGGGQYTNTAPGGGGGSLNTGSSQTNTQGFQSGDGLVVLSYNGVTPTANVVSNVTCAGGNNGSASVNVVGGSSPYTYAWTPSGGNSSNATGLTAGMYTVTVHDAGGCSATASVNITQPGALTVSANVTTDVSCNGGNNGSITAVVNGGGSPYTYAWTPAGGTSSVANGLTAATYTLTVHDACGASATASAVITQPATLTVSASVTANVSCNGGNNGGVTSSPGGGTAPYTYSWTPGGSTTASVTGLSGGCYTVTVQDAHGCSATANTCITEPTALTASASTTANPLCNGDATGSTSSSVSGGTGAYTYSWAPTGGNGSNASALNANTYTLTVQDANGCSATASTVVTEPSALTVTASTTANALCNGDAIGSTTSSASGGTGAYTYSWAPAGGNGSNATGLTAGTYTLTLSDANGCSATASTVITEPTSLTVTANSTSDVLCHGGNDGGATSSVGGGTAPYTYSWSSGSTNATATGLSAGTYTLALNDANGCSASAQVTITQPAALSIAMSSTPDNGSCNGTAQATVTGGTAPYTYAWVGGGNADTIKGRCHGNYCCVVHDANGCADSACVNINSASGVLNINDAQAFHFYPDPNTGLFTISGVKVGQVVTLFNYMGQKLSTIVSDNNTAMHIDITGWPNGIYMVRIQNSNGTLVIDKKIIKQ